MILIEASRSPAAPWLMDLQFPYSKPAIAQLKAVPGIHCERVDPEGAPGYWHWSGSVDAVEAAGKVLQAAKVAKLQWPLADQSTQHYQIDGALRPYQALGVARIVIGLRAEGAFLLADDMGLGKSLQALAALSQVASGPTVIICPASVVTSWAAQIAKWRPGDQYIAITKPKQVKALIAGEWLFALPQPQWLVVGYERACQLIKAGVIGQGCNCVLDEIHYCKTPTAARSKVIRQFVMAVRASGGVTLGLSGTPMTVRPRDLHNILDLLWPGRFGDFFQFGRRYCDGKRVEVPRLLTPEGTPKKVWNFDGSSREPELAARLAHCMLRRTKAEVASELPALTRICREVELPTGARSDLRKAVALTSWEAAGFAKSAGALLSAAEGYKIEAALELAAEVIASGGRPLLICHRRKTAWALAERLNCPVVTGKTPLTDRLSSMTAEPTGPAVATIRSIGTGLDGLQAAFDVQIHVGLGYRPSDLTQCESRIHRIGQALPVFIYYLIGMGSIDEAVREILIDRLDTFNALLSASDSGTQEAQMADGFRGRDEDIMAALCARIEAM